MLHAISKVKEALLLRRWRVPLVCLLFLPGWCRGQGAAGVTPKKPLLDFSGQVSMFTDVYWTSDNKLSAHLMQREEFVQRVLVGAQLKVWKLKIPMDLMIGTPLKRLGDLEIPRPNFKQTFLNPRNEFGLHPTIGKLTMHIGSHTFKASKITAGNMPFMTGLGFDFKDKNFHVAASYGITQAFVQRDIAARLAGQFHREMGGLHIALGNEKTNRIMLNYVRARDLLPRHVTRAQMPSGTRVDGGLVSIGGNLRLFNLLYWQSEVGISIYSADADAVDLGLDLIDPNGNLRQQYGSYIEWAKRLFLFNAASLPGYSVQTRLGLKQKKWDLGLNAEAISAGFRNLAWGYQQNDHLDLTLDGNLKLFDGRLRLHAGAGGRSNNLMLIPFEPPTKVSRNQQLIYEGSATATLLKLVNLSGSYSTSGFQTVRLPSITGLVDSVAQRQGNSSLGLNASISLGKWCPQTASVHFNRDAYQSYADANPDLVVLDLTTIMFGYNHQITFPNAFGVNMGFNHVQNQELQQWNAQLGLQGAWLKNKLVVMAQVMVGDGSGTLDGGRLAAFSMNMQLRLHKSIGAGLMLNARRPSFQGRPFETGLARLKLTYTFDPKKK